MGVWIDTDMGFDDLWALIAMAEAERAGTIGIDGVSLVFGCATLARVHANARAAWDVFGWRWPRHLGRDRAILGERETAERILGPTGIRTSGETLPDIDGTDDRPSPALDALAAWLASDDAPRPILALGPLTNLTALVIARPDLAARIDSIVWMGGSRGPGNHTPAAEFNAFADPEALAALAGHGVTIVMVDLEACRQVTVGASAVDDLRAQSGPRAALLADLLAGYVEIARARGREAMAVYDPIAALALLRPELFALRETGLAVTLDGPERGRTRLGDDHAARVRIVDDLDVPALTEACLQTLSREAER